VPEDFRIAEVRPLQVPGLGATRQVAIIRHRQAQEHAA